VVLGADQTWSVSTNHILHAYGTIAGGGSLSLKGYGQVIFYTNNAFSGDTRLLRGALSVKHTNALQNSTVDLNPADSGTLNLNNLNDSEFVGWKTDEMDSLMNTSRMMLEEIQGIVADKLKNG